MPKLTIKGTSTVTITRKTGTWGAFSSMIIFANEDNIGQLANGEQVAFDLGEGIYHFHVEMGGGYKSDNLILDMKNGETATIDISTIRAGQNMLPMAIAMVVVNLWALVDKSILSNCIRLVVCVICFFMVIPLFFQRKQFFILS